MDRKKAPVVVPVILSVISLVSAAQPARAQLLSTWGHPVITFGWTPYNSINAGHGNYPGSPGFIPGYGYYPGPSPNRYPWMDGPDTLFDRRMIPSAFPANGQAENILAQPFQESRIPAGAALIIVKVPAQAEIWFNDKKTSQGGSYRQFVTPPLPGGRQLFYTIRARWRIQPGVELTRVEETQVQPGGRFTVDFLTANAWTGRRLPITPKTPAH